MLNTNPAVLCAWSVDGVRVGGEFRRSRSIHPGALPDALHYNCPWCGRRWASTVPVDWPSDWPPMRWVALTAPCSECGTGSLANVTENLYYLPYSLLRRELEIACNAPEEYDTLHFFERPRRQT